MVAHCGKLGLQKCKIKANMTDFAFFFLDTRGSADTIHTHAWGTASLDLDDSIVIAASYWRRGGLVSQSWS